LRLGVVWGETGGNLFQEAWIFFSGSRIIFYKPAGFLFRQWNFIYGPAGIIY
jgi:hypothetical protein